MTKQFKTNEELSTYISNLSPNSYDFSNYYIPSESDVINSLKNDGYDLSNLIEDGHAYEIGGFTNNGWLYEDEADLEYIASINSNVELRSRH